MKSKKMLCRSGSMTFLKAIHHASIGYVIRRETWEPHVTVGFTGVGELEWLHPSVYKPVHILDDTDPGISLTVEDIKATDWIYF